MGFPLKARVGDPLVTSGNPMYYPGITNNSGLVFTYKLFITLSASEIKITD
jgi:hypothetical protein